MKEKSKRQQNKIEKSIIRKYTEIMKVFQHKYLLIITTSSSLLPIELLSFLP